MFLKTPSCRVFIVYSSTNMTLCTIRYNLYNLNVKITDGGVILLGILQFYE